jgi:hypothetical protein
MFSNSPGYYCFKTTFFQLYNTFNALKLAVDMSIISSMATVTVNNSDMVSNMLHPCLVKSFVF